MFARLKEHLCLGKIRKFTLTNHSVHFCGACKNVCPVDEALCVKRTKVLHTPIHSGTWNKALERITSSADAAKELKAQAAENRRQSR